MLLHPIFLILHLIFFFFIIPNFPGLEVMPKLFVTRWRRKKQLFLSSVKDCFTQDTGPIHSLPLDTPTPLIAETVQQTTMPLTRPKRARPKITLEIVSTMAPVGRPTKIGKALELDQLNKKTKKTKPAKRLVNFKPRN